MVIDTSALCAILLREPERDDFVTAMASADVRLVGVPNAFETAIVLLARKGPAGVRELDLLLHKAQVELVAFTEDHLLLAREAYERFGKGRHPAQLNFGDCCAYAVARYAGAPLLYKGGDFAQTDILPAR